MTASGALAPQELKARATLSDEERQRRIQLACGYLLGVIPWPEVAQSPAESPPAGHKEGAAPSNATPVREMDLTRPDQRVLACPPQS
jgi:hypothetical protein